MTVHHDSDQDAVPLVDDGIDPRTGVTKHPVRETAHAFAHRLQSGVSALHGGDGPGLHERLHQVKDVAAQTLIEADARTAYSKERFGAWREEKAGRLSHAAGQNRKTLIAGAAAAAAVLAAAMTALRLRKR